jgi:hypothetical protein
MLTILLNLVVFCKAQVIELNLCGTQPSVMLVNTSNQHQIITCDSPNSTLAIS